MKQSPGSAQPELKTPQLTAANHYRIKAAEFAALARAEAEPQQQVEFARMAASYLRLAEQADRNALTDVTYDRRSDKVQTRP